MVKSLVFFNTKNTKIQYDPAWEKHTEVPIVSLDFMMFFYHASSWNLCEAILIFTMFHMECHDERNLEIHHTCFTQCKSIQNVKKITFYLKYSGDYSDIDIYRWTCYEKKHKKHWKNEKRKKKGRVTAPV